MIDIYPKKAEVDVKYVWEFNRHQFLPYLGFAYYFTGDENYALEFKTIVIDWIKNNPPLYGINWFSGLEVSIRLTSWIFSLYFFKSSKEINNNDFFRTIFKSLFEHSYYLRNFYTKRSLNHTIGDLFGLCLFSKVFEEIRPISKWKNKFFKKFRLQLKLQVRSDGTNIEQSSNYHRFVLEFFLLHLVINPNEVIDKERIVIEKMLDYLLYVVKPNGQIPIIGDNDDGMVILLNDPKKKLNCLFNLGAILFGRSDLKYIYQKLYPSSILLLGENGCEIFKSLLIKKPSMNWRYFDKAGYFMIRNKWTPDANYFFMDCGKFGAFKGAHSHSSITNIIFSYNGNDIMIDSGTSSYNRSLSERNLFRSSKAHNVLTIDHNNQAEFQSYFSWENLPKIKRIFSKNDDQIELTCSHDGYKGFQVKRKAITNMKLATITIEDSIYQIKKNAQKHESEINIYYHFNDVVNLILVKDSVIIDNQLILSVDSDRVINLTIEKQYHAPFYGFKSEHEVLNIHLKNDFKEKNMIYVKSTIKPIVKIS